MNINTILQKMLDNEKHMNNCINLVSSENQISSFAKLALISDSYNRYFFNSDLDPQSWNFQGCKFIQELETDICIPTLKRLARAKYVNIRPLSGLSCMMLVLNALGGKKGSRIISISPNQGGHYATKDLSESLGFKIDFFPGMDGQSFDYDKFEQLIRENEYSLVYIDQSYCLFPIDLSKTVKIVKRNTKKTLVHVDVSHTMGLVFGEVHVNPLSVGADSFGGSTHKTFPGPQKGIFCTNSEELANKVKDFQFFMISHHHFGEVLSLGISLSEFETCGGKEYSKQILKNAKLLAQCLDKYGYDVKYKERGFTETHQIWVSTSNIGIDTYEAAMKLYNFGIITNVLYDLPVTNEATLRIGINEFTWLGAKENEIIDLASIIHDIVCDNDISNISDSIHCLRKKLTKPYCFKNVYDSSLISKYIHETLYDIL